KEVIAGKKQILLHSSHKDLETAYLDQFTEKQDHILVVMFLGNNAKLG
mgnify:CR=1